MPNRKLKRAASIAALNDQMRREPRNKALGQVVITAGVAAEGDAFRLKVKEALAALGPRDFTPANDPYGERDFCAFHVDGQRLFFKVDYFSKGDLTRASEDPADQDKTERVMTIMFAEEY